MGQLSKNLLWVVGCIFEGEAYFKTDLLWNIPLCIFHINMYVIYQRLDYVIFGAN